MNERRNRLLVRIISLLDVVGLGLNVDAREAGAHVLISIWRSESLVHLLLLLLRLLLLGHGHDRGLNVLLLRRRILRLLHDWLLGLRINRLLRLRSGILLGRILHGCGLSVLLLRRHSVVLLLRNLLLWPLLLRCRSLSHHWALVGGRSVLLLLLRGHALGHASLLNRGGNGLLHLRRLHERALSLVQRLTVLVDLLLLWHRRRRKRLLLGNGIIVDHRARGLSWMELHLLSLRI